MDSLPQYFLHKRSIFPFGIKQSLLAFFLLTISFPHVQGLFFQKQTETSVAVITTYATSTSKKSDTTSVVRVQPVSQVSQLAIGKKEIVMTPTPQVSKNDVWGIAKQVDAQTWSMQVGKDERIGTSQEIFSALNAYRQKNGKGTLSWDDKLTSYAVSRVQLFTQLNTTDKHAGFVEYMHNNGFNILGFMSLGENSSFGYQLAGVHLIEWVYAGDKPHDDNQLNSSWTHVGIGVSGLATDLIFGGSKQ